VKCRKVAHSKPTPCLGGFLECAKPRASRERRECFSGSLWAATTLLNPLSCCEAETVHSGALRRQEGIHMCTLMESTFYPTLFSALDYHGHSCVYTRKNSVDISSSSRNSNSGVWGERVVTFRCAARARQWKMNGVGRARILDALVITVE
jgi:hypothetical protein